MTVISTVQPVPFPSNGAYLAWEMARLQQRLNAYLAAKDDVDALDAYDSVLVQLAESRPAGIAARQEAVESGVAIPFDALSRQFGLSPNDEEVLMVCLAPHLSATNAHLLNCAQGNVLKTYLEVGFVGELTLPTGSLMTARRWCDADSPLVRGGLIVIDRPPEGAAPVSLLAHAVYSPHYVAAAVTGVPDIDQRLSDFCEIGFPDTELFDIVLAEETREQVEDFVRGFYRRNAPMQLGGRSWTLLLSGPRRSGKTSLARAIARSFRRPLFQVHLERLERRAEAATLLRLAARNAQFMGAVLLLGQPEHLLSVDPSSLGTLLGIVDDYRGLCVIEPHDPDALPSAFEPLIQFPIAMERNTSQGLLELWEGLLPSDIGLSDDVDLMHLSSAYGLTGGQVDAAIAWARQRAETRGDATLTHDDLRTGARSQVRSKLGNFTDASRVKLTLDDLILAEEPMALIQELLDACRNRRRVLGEWGFGQRLVTGKGLITLFSGEAGTGKTLCAEILANELDLQLHIVSIPKVVSKWVGETEKNIREIFTHARAQNSMLLFDEADSLFTTRVKVEKAQDHFQNMEVNMLLQEIERFEGIVILTTNLEANIDRAFQRRILFKVAFPVPEAPQREKIWRALIPTATPLEEDVDFEYLGEGFELTGGQIKNAVIRAAYRACSAGEILTQDRLVDAALQQAKEAGKLTRRL